MIAIEKKYQAQWQKDRIFEANAPTPAEVPIGSMTAEELRKKYPKHMGIFAYPYTNGLLHAGHCFTVSKIEFSASFARMQGKRVLFPLGYHVTGMPIKACADKLIDDVRQFGQNFEGYEEQDEPPAKDSPAPTQQTTKEDVTKFTSKKGKQAAKTIKAKHQFQIMLAQGIPKEEIHKFSDTKYWLEYFPPLVKRDMIAFGTKVDWRRQMLTTDANPYYDAFIRWQMNRLYETKKILFGDRYTIYSPKDGQPCMDHDRAEGEAIGPQEYTALKLRVKEWSPKAAAIVKGKIPAEANVYFVPATLRPETMYGQTCCFVGPKITYGLFKVSETEYFVCTKRAAWNMAFQGRFFSKDKFPRSQSELPAVVDLPGPDCVGTLVEAPLSVHTNGIRILPMETVSPTKGTGVVTCVPSDSPDDYATVKELEKKAEFYGIEREWVSFDILPLIDTPAYGNLCAEYLVKKMKIQSPKDAKLLAEAKELAYKEGYYKGTMLVGKFKGDSVETAKPKVRDELLASGEAFAYADPAGHVVSRSGDECVVAFLGQWFLNYGENDAEWRDTVVDWVKNDLQTYTSETQNGLIGNLDWLNRWACAREFGLGSRLPWDRKWLVESLSDSTVYMAYYTVAHFLHGDMFARTPGLFSISPEQMIDEVWDYLFCRRKLDEALLEKCGIPKLELETMRREFEYWYPLDISSSGKDLIPNHLTFFLYIHIALFPREYWPRSIRTNGHLLLNGEKMSKSTGNFMTMEQAVGKFGADATRVAIADAGDGVDDANFDETVANSNILRLFTLKEWCEEIIKDKTLREGAVDGFWDKLFENELNSIVLTAKKHYEQMEYKLALKAALYDFTAARDFYREMTIANGTGMHRALVRRFVELQALILNPLAPHWSDYIWQEVLEHPTSIQHELFPTVPTPVASLTAAREYVRLVTGHITSAEGLQIKRLAKGKTMSYDPKAPKRLTIFAAADFPKWQAAIVDVVRQKFEAQQLADAKDFNSSVMKTAGKEKKAMPFAQDLRRKLESGEPSDAVLNRKLPFGELDVLQEMTKGLGRTTGCKEIEVILVDEGGKSGQVMIGNKGEKRAALPPQAEAAVPGIPTFAFENIKT